MNDQIQSPSEFEDAIDQPSSPRIDPFELETYMRKLEAEQSLVGGFFGGLVGMVIGAGLWAAITLLTDYQIGWMAIGVGFLVGISVRFAGRGLRTSFGIIGGFLSLVGCVFGNLLMALIIVSQQFEVPFSQVLLNLNMSIIIELMTITFSPIDLLFYGLAIYTGYRYAFRTITEEELAKLAR